MDHQQEAGNCVSCGTDESVTMHEHYDEISFCEPCLDRAGPAEWPYDDLGGSE